MLKFPIACVLAAALFLTGCGSKAPVPTANPPATVTSAVIQPKAWTDTIEALGTTRARESVTLTAKITETVRRVNFVDGQHVDAGDVLVELTSGQQVAALAETQASHKDAERQLARNKDLLEQGTISRAMYDTLQSTRDSSKARVDALRAQLSDRVVTAPFAGVLGLRQVSVGALVTPGTVITTLDDTRSVYLDFALAEVHLAAVETGQSITARSAAFPGRKFDGVITSLDARVDPVTRALTVRAEIPNPDGALRPGMMMTTQVLLPTRDVLAAPEIAVTQVGSDSFLFVLDGDQAKQVKVVLGARRRGEVEILDGLDAGTRVVIDGTVKLRDGSRVRDVTAIDTATATD